MDDPDYYSSENTWTDLGLKKINECLLLSEECLIMNRKITAKELMEYFTINYITKRLSQEIK